jgi:hypothetical protein
MKLISARKTIEPALSVRPVPVDHRRSRRAALVTLAGTSACFLAPALLGGCSSIDRTDNYREFSHTLDAIYIAGTKSLVVVLGEHHYVFTDAEDLIQTIALARRQPMVVQNLRLVVPLDGSAHTRLVFVVEDSRPMPEKIAAQAAGFTSRLHPRDLSGELEKRFTLQGRRFAAGNTQLPSDPTRLTRPYEIAVSEQYPVGISRADVAHAALTPVRVAANGALLLLGAPLLMLSLAANSDCSSKILVCLTWR